MIHNFIKEHFNITDSELNEVISELGFKNYVILRRAVVNEDFETIDYLLNEDLSVLRPNGEINPYLVAPGTELILTSDNGTYIPVIAQRRMGDDAIEVQEPGGKRSTYNVSRLNIPATQATENLKKLAGIHETTTSVNIASTPSIAGNMKQRATTDLAATRNKEKRKKECMKRYYKIERKQK